jgi:hypothetical protein
VEKDKLPLRAPEADGRNRTVTVQVAPAFNDVPQDVPTKLKSVPDTDAAVGVVTLMAASPVFCSVAVDEVFEPTARLPKAIPESVAEGAWPVPVRLTFATPPPLCTKLSVPVRVPAAEGLKVTLTVQVPPTATEPQPFDCAKSLLPVEIPTPVNVKVLVPVLVTVTVCTLLVVDVC